MVFILYSLAMLPKLSPSPPLPFPLALLSPCPLFVVDRKCIRTQRRQGYSQGNRQGFWSYSQGNRLLLVSLKNPLALDGLWSHIFRETGYKSFVYLGFLLRLPGKRAVVSLIGNSSSMGLLVQCSVLHEKILFVEKKKKKKNKRGKIPALCRISCLAPWTLTAFFPGISVAGPVENMA